MEPAKIAPNETQTMIGQPTPLPKLQLTVVYLLQMAENVALLMAHALIPFMVEDWFPDLSASEVGYWSGHLFSVVYVAQIFSQPAWGVMADKIGRRPVLLMGITLLNISVAMFGLAPNYAWGLFARFLWGLGCGNTPVIKVHSYSQAQMPMRCFGEHINSVFL